VSILIAATGTNIGKTICSALLIAKYSKTKKLRYWKPVQTGADKDSDTKTVELLTGGIQESFLPTYNFQFPSSPDFAARKEGRSIEFAKLQHDFIEHSNHCKMNDEHILVETAGGVMVPLSEELLTIDFIKMTDLPVLLILSRELGTINHSLLTLNALHQYHIPIAGFFGFGKKVLSEDESLIWENSILSIGRWGKAEYLGDFCMEENLTPSNFQSIAVEKFDTESKMEKLFQ
jgi:dethiobiotin synthetase